MANDHGDQPGWGKRTLTSFIIDRGCTELKELAALRTEGWEDETLKHELDQHYSKTKKKADQSTAKNDLIWLPIMSDVLKCMDVCNGNFIPCEGRLRFLDLGCCPGGFSDYVLTKNFDAQGVGVSLSVDNGGHGLAIPFPQRKRFEMHWADLTFYDICLPRCPPSWTPGVVPVPFSGSFQLAMLDGHHRRPQESELTHPWDIPRLLISQLIIAFASLETGGTLLAKLHRLEGSTTARILYMLDTLSLSINAFKPRKVHTTKSSFYVVAKGFGRGVQGSKIGTYLEQMQRVWLDLTYGGEEGTGRYLAEDDLDFIVNFDDLSGPYLDRIIELGRKTWLSQGEALEKQYREKRRQAERKRVH